MDKVLEAFCDTMAVVMPIGFCLLLAACAVTPIPIGLPCNVGPVILDKADHLTRSTAEQIVVLNESGQKLCQWKPPAKK